MEKRELGRTGIFLTELGFGCASVWGKMMISDEEAEKVFLEAYSSGIRYFDTGHSYGNAEERIGKILKKNNIPREDIVISTKFGTRLINGKYVHDVSSNWIKESVRMSLERMGISYIDCLLIHGPGIGDFTDELYNTLDSLKKEGLVKAIGANSFDDDVLEKIYQEGKLDFVMLDYNIMRPDRVDLIRRFHEKGMGVIAGAALAESLFSNRVFQLKGKKDIWYLLRAIKNFRGQLVHGRNYRFINDYKDYSGHQIALRYVLNNECVCSAVFGTTSSEHLKENVGALDISIPPEIIEKIKKIK